MLGQVTGLPHREAQTFVETWHYSNRMPTGKNICFAWLVEGQVYAVAVYGIGVNPYQASYLSRITGDTVTREGLVELKRLARVEPRVESAYLTQFLAACHKLLKAQGYTHVVSFSDPSQGHEGGIYKAANFHYAGKTNPEFHVVGSDGVVRHRRFPFRYARRNGVSVPEARRILGLRRVQTAAKDRWLLRLHKNSRIKVNI